MKISMDSPLADVMIAVDEAFKIVWDDEEPDQVTKLSYLGLVVEAVVKHKTAVTLEDIVEVMSGNISADQLALRSWTDEAKAACSLENLIPPGDEVMLVWYVAGIDPENVQELVQQFNATQPPLPGTPAV